MTGTTSLDRTGRRIAGASSFISGALAVYWLIEILRSQVPGVHATNVKINIVLWAIVALVFGQVAKRRETLDRSLYAPIVFASLSAYWALRFVFTLNARVRHDYGPAGVVTCALTVGLLATAFLLRRRWRRNAAQPGVDPDGAARRGLTP